MLPTGQTSNNSLINIRWWNCPLPSDPSLALPHPKSWIKIHFLLLAKIIEYATETFSQVCAQWNCVDNIFWSNGNIWFPTSVIYTMHSKLLQVNDWSFS